ncbi:MAG: hypothetical protein KC766_39165, partial [Myxococcales bacterium]|nr:hypothetical protein [Myxococcales bacterium]
TMYYSGTIPNGAAAWGVQGGFGGGVWTPIKWQNFSIGPILPFADPVQIAPEGLVSAPFDLKWELDGSAARYDVLIWDGNNQNVFSNEYPRGSLGCSVEGEVCTLSGIALPPGNYSWWVRPQNAQGTTGTWSAGLAFEVDDDPPSPVWPTADITDTDDTPTYVFTELPGATAYYFSIAEASGVYHLPTQLALTDVDCDGGLCRYTSPIPLEEGAARWGIRARDAAYNWQGWRYAQFSYHGVPTLSVPTPISPATTTTSPVAPQWSADPAATYYDLWIRSAVPGSPQLHFSRTNKYDAGCSDGTGLCTGPSVTLPTGEYRLVVASANVHGRGGLSSSTYFSVDDSAPTPLTPSGEISDNTPVYRFTERADATQYRMTVLHSAGYRSQYFYPSEVSCSGGVCEFTLLDSSTPDPDDEYVLPPGAARWHVSALVNGTWTAEDSINFSVGPLVAPGPIFAVAPDRPTTSPVSFEWTPDAGSHRYSLQVRDSNDALVFNSNRYAADVGCDDLVSNCVWSGISLPDGNYTWTAKGFNQQNTTAGWTPPMPFSVYTQTLTPISPVGEISQPRPTYTFSEQLGARYYQVTLFDGLGLETLVVPAIDANCFAGTCSVDLPRDVAPGAAFWRVRAEMGSGVWTPYVSLNFSRGPSQPVGAVTAISPNSPVTAPVTYTWSSDPGSQRYFVQVQDLTGTSVYGVEVTPTDANCANGESVCSFVAPQSPAQGDYRWRVRGRNVQNEYGPWSALLDFAIGDLPGAPTVLAPVGNLHDSLPV